MHGNVPVIGASVHGAKPQPLLRRGRAFVSADLRGLRGGLDGGARVVVCAVGAGHVEDDLGGLGVYLFGDGGEGAEELVGDVGEDGGAAGGKNGQVRLQDGLRRRAFQEIIDGIVKDKPDCPQYQREP